MNSSGILLDTGPLVALLSKDDSNHRRAKELFAKCEPPFRCCDAVITEACFLLGKVHRSGPAEVMALGRTGFYSLTLPIADHWMNIETLLNKYADRPISLADACLIRCAEIFDEARIATYDADFNFYRWAGKRKFQVL